MALNCPATLNVLFQLCVASRYNLNSVARFSTYVILFVFRCFGSLHLDHNLIFDPIIFTRFTCFSCLFLNMNIQNYIVSAYIPNYSMNHA